MATLIYPKCKWCHGHGCVLCPVEHDREIRELEASVRRRYERTGEYCDPDFEEFRGQYVYHDLKTQKSYVMRPDIQVIEEAVG